MEEPVNISFDDVLDLIKEFPIQPVRNYLVISLNTTEVPFVDEEGENQFDLMDQIFADEQYVLAASATAIGGVQPGAKVLLDIEKIQRLVRTPEGEEKLVPNVRYVEVDDKMYGIIPDSYVVAINKDVE